MELHNLERHNGCPAPDLLLRFNLGRLAPQLLDELSTHVSNCSRCCSILDQIQNRAADDPVIAAVRCSFQQPHPEEAACARLAAAAAGVCALEWGAETQPELAPDRAGNTAPLPRAIGPYQLLERVGRGGMGVVYRARQPALHREVALKMIRAGLEAGPDAEARFHTEGKAIARLQHPNVVEIYDFGEHEGQPYFSMEFLGGGSLAAKLAQGPLPPRAAAELIQTLASAVESAHQRGVLHRDLKPANVLLTPDGRPKITDFGLAKLLDADGTQTQSDAVLGTPSYMAPEQADGRTKAIGPATDVYALGAILYEALTGQPPFRGDSPTQTRRLVLLTEPALPSRLRREVPRPLEAICLKCLEKEPARRYPSAQALADDLGRWLRGEQPQDTPRWPERAVRTLRRRAVAVGTVATLLLVLTAVATVAYLGDPERPLRQIERELAAGRPVSLIGETGKPAWFRWRAGEMSSQLMQADDGAFRVDAWVYSLLDLLPNSMCERYRLTAQVRHERSRLIGQVGLYVGCIAYPIEGGEVEFFIQLTFNDVNVAQAPPITVNGRNVKSPSSMNRVFLLPHLYSQEGTPPNVDCSMVGRMGPRFRPAGEHATGWHNLAVTVTPEEVLAEWDGLALHLNQEEITAAVSTAMAELRPRYPDFPLLQNTQPQFTVRGGLGLYVHRGSASFRAVTVTPLTGDR